MDPFRNTSWFDGMGSQRWTVLMQAHLQATGLEVWNIVNEGIKFKTLKEKQNDVIAKSIILSSLSHNVFNHIYSCENAKELWKTIIENHEARRMLPMKDIIFSFISLIALSNLMMRMPNPCTHD